MLHQTKATLPQNQHLFWLIMNIQLWNMSPRTNLLQTKDNSKRLQYFYDVYTTVDFGRQDARSYSGKYVSRDLTKMQKNQTIDLRSCCFSKPFWDTKQFFVEIVSGILFPFWQEALIWITITRDISIRIRRKSVITTFWYELWTILSG